MVDVRLLNQSDAASWQALRLRALRDHPEAFASSYEDEVSTPIDDIAERIKTSLPDIAYFGAFVNDDLIGQAGLFRPLRLKARHRTALWGMYVAPESRGKGAGDAMMQAAVDYALKQPDLEEIELAVTVGNEAARRLYARFGFVKWGTEPRYLKIAGTFYDLDWMILRLKR